MAKKSLTEAEQKGVVKKVVNAIFNAVANKKTTALEKRMMKDPEFKASVERLEKLRDELETHFEKTVYNQPGYEDFSAWYEKSIRPLSK